MGAWGNAGTAAKIVALLSPISKRESTRGTLLTVGCRLSPRRERWFSQIGAVRPMMMFIFAQYNQTRLEYFGGFLLKRKILQKDQSFKNEVTK